MTLRTNTLALLAPFLGLPLLGTACGDKDGDDTGDVPVDADADGATADEDCDDDDPERFPGADEVCDDKDNDCDGDVDEDPVDATTWYADSDVDGYGDADVTTEACDAPDAYAAEAGDCDDLDPDTYPGADEICDDADNDCDSEVDENAVDAPTWYVDADGDGYGDADVPVAACTEPDGYVANADDCEDALAGVNPAAVEICNGLDDDCDPATEEEFMAAFEAADGTFTDRTSDILGIEEAPGDVLLDEAGTLWVCPGDYSATVEIAADATLTGLSGVASDVTIDGEATGSVVSVTASGVSAGISHVTLTDGLGVVGEVLDATTGGGIRCEDTAGGGTLLTIEGVAVEDSSAEYGAGVHTVGCNTVMEDVRIGDNMADSAAGGMLAWDGTHSLRDVLIEDNTSAFEIGGAYFLALEEDTVEVGLDEVRVVDNMAEAAAGIGWADANVLWTGTDESASGARGNVDDDGYGAVTHNLGSTFEADTIDLVAADDTGDNAPYDLYDAVGLARFDLGDDVSFSCDDTEGCGTRDAATVGGTDYSSSGEYILLNTVEAELDGSLSRVAMYLEGNSDCVLDWYVFSSPDTPPADGSESDWTLEWVDSGYAMTDSTDWFEAWPAVPVEEGTWYAVGAGWRCESGGVGYAWDYEASTPGDAGWGTTGAYVWSDNTTTVEADTTFDGSSDSALYYMDFEFASLPE